MKKLKEAIMPHEQHTTGKIKVTFKQALGMIIPYAKKKTLEQIKTVSLIVLYLVFFQILILGIPVDKSIEICIGIFLVIIGLTFFMEGLSLGLMPLGEICGVKLPQKSKLPVILVFAFILGIGATFAEPAVGVLKAAGSSVKAWNAPLLFVMLNKYSSYLILSVGIGVGLAVLLGMLRFLYQWSLKPLIYSFILILCSISIWAYFDKNLIYLTGLAWDCGGVTTGPVTVPLVLALGIGITRVIGDKENGSAGGFGVVTLASIFPVLTVFILGIIISGFTPYPSSEKDFFKHSNKENFKILFNDEEETIGYVLNNCSSTGQTSFFANKTKEANVLARISSNSKYRNKVFGDKKKFLEWFHTKASERQKQLILGSSKSLKKELTTHKKNNDSEFNIMNLIIKNGQMSIQAIIPLTLFLLFVLIIILHERISRLDEIFLGIFFAVIGMGLFNIGIETGLSNLGNQVGSKLPSSFKEIEIVEKKEIINNFDKQLIQKSINQNGKIENIFFAEIDGNYKIIPFEKKYYDETSGNYVYIPKKSPIFGHHGTVIGIILILIFGFFMGYGATLAEPALNALGSKVEELTVGTFKKSLLMQTVAIGVGLGISVGVAKIIWNIPLVWLLVPPYLLLLILTLISNEDYVNIGWDSAGVTTGPITVPLVIAMGLGISLQVGAVEGFGILATASAYPILSVLSVGLYVTYKRRKILTEAA
jgi:hypothetical protein